MPNRVLKPASTVPSARKRAAVSEDTRHILFRYKKPDGTEILLGEALLFQRTSTSQPDARLSRRWVAPLVKSPGVTRTRAST